MILASALPLAAKKPQPVMHTAKVVSQDISTQNGGAAAMPLGTMIVAVPISVVTNSVAVETEHAFMTWVEKRTKHPLVLPINGTVEFYQDGNWVVVLDSNHKKHRFAVTHIEQKDKAQ